MKKYLFLSIIFSSSLYAETLHLDPYQIEIYQNKSFIISTSQVNLNKKGSLDISFPASKNVENAVVSIENLSCNILFERENKVENKEIKKLKEKLKFFYLLLETKQAEKEAFKRIDIDKSDIEKIYQKYNKLLKEIDNLKKQIETLKEKLHTVQDYIGKSLEISYKCSMPTKSYIKAFSPVNISGYQEYVISGYTDKKKIKIDNILVLKNHTNITFKNISVKYHSFMKNPSIEPPSFNRPIYRTFQKAIVAAAPTSVYKETFSKSFFYISNVSLPKKETIKVNVSSNIYPADFSIYIDGYATVTPFLMAKFKADKNLPASFNSKFFIDGLFLGKGRIKAIEKGKENKVFFGEDVLFNVRKEKIEDKFKRISLNKIKHTVKWKYFLKNNHKTGVQVTIVDKLPNETPEKDIRYISDIQWSKHTADGKVIWKIFLKPNQEMNFSFGYIETYKIKE